MKEDSALDQSAVPVAKADSASPTPETETIPARHSKIFDEVKLPPMRPAARFAVLAALILVGIYCLLGGFVISTTTIAILPAFVNAALTMPLESTLGLIAYLLAAISHLILGILLPTFAYLIFRKKSFKRSLVILGCIALVAAAISRFVLLPIFAAHLQS